MRFLLYLHYFSLSESLTSRAMAEKPAKVYSLLALSQSIRNLIYEKIGQQQFWLKAEIAQIKQAASGHWYLELVQEKAGMRLASMQAAVWSLDYEQILQKHGPEVNKILVQGQELVLKVMVDYHAIYGLKLIIKDLDLSFVLGELERRKRETLEKLKQAGLLQKQKDFKEKLVWQKIAVLSSEGAAAYQDFLQHLKENEFGYRLQSDLYPVPVQGAAAADKIRTVLEHLPHKNYDLVVIIRGGGSRLDLDCFNDEALAKTVANFPIPVQTGIGHESDWTVLDLVAFKAHKTPTAVADYLLDKMSAFEGALQQMAELLQRKSQDCLKFEDQSLLRFHEILNMIPISQVQKKRGDVHNVAGILVRETADALRKHERLIEAFTMHIKDLPRNLIRRQRDNLENLQKDLNLAGQRQMTRIQKDLHNLNERLELLKPERTLERGYSITRKGDKSIRSIKEVKEGELLKTQLKDGLLESKIIKVESHD